MAAHAKHSPSTLPKKALCPRFAPSPFSGTAAQRGTRIHEQLQSWVTNRSVTVLPNGEADIVNVGIRVFEDLKTRFPGHSWKAECKVDTGIAGVYGTVDLVGTDDWNDELVVLDWKTGTGGNDDAGKNLQTIAYALGAMATLQVLPTKIICMVAELDKGEITEAVFTPAELQESEIEIRELVQACEAATDNEAVPGDRQCKYCDRKKTCPALTGIAATTTIAVQDKAGEVSTLTNDAILVALRWIQPRAKLVEQYAEAIENEVKRRITAGEEIPGIELKKKVCAYEWDAATTEAKVIETLTELNTEGKNLPSIMEMASSSDIIKRAYGAGIATKKDLEQRIRAMTTPRYSTSIVIKEAK